MNVYYDTGILLKLYTEEKESAAVRAYVTGRGKPILVNDLHLAECVSALRLKQFRGECEPKQSGRALHYLDDDVRKGVLRMVPIDWTDAWRECRLLAYSHAAATGCRTLDTIHLACARLTDARDFVTSDHRQIAMAELVGLRVVNPVTKVAD